MITCALAFLWQIRQDNMILSRSFLTRREHVDLLNFKLCEKLKSHAKNRYSANLSNYFRHFGNLCRCWFGCCLGTQQIYWRDTVLCSLTMQAINKAQSTWNMEWSCCTMYGEIVFFHESLCFGKGRGIRSLISSSSFQLYHCSVLSICFISRPSILLYLSVFAKPCFTHLPSSAEV